MGKQRGHRRRCTYRTAQDRRQDERGEEIREATAGKGWGMALRRPHSQALCGSQTPTLHARPLARSPCSPGALRAPSIWFASSMHPRHLRCLRTTAPRRSHALATLMFAFGTGFCALRAELVAAVSAGGPPHCPPHHCTPPPTPRTSLPFRQCPSLWAYRALSATR